jgi:hypothetical protein
MLSNPPESKPKALTRDVIPPIEFIGKDNNLTMPKPRKTPTKPDQTENLEISCPAASSCPFFRNDLKSILQITLLNSELLVRGRLWTSASSFQSTKNRTS